MAAATLAKPPVQMPVQQVVRPKLLTMINEVNDFAYERQEVVWAIVVALLSRQHVLLVGPPGTAKTMITKALARRIVNINYFETTLDETTTPDEVFGPPDIPRMIKSGQTRRVTTNMLPDAHLALLDEFFNGNGPVLHKSQPILNERVFHNGDLVQQCPLRTVVAGTNKLNADADQAALWDRMHFRLHVEYLADRDNVETMLMESLLRRASNYVPDIRATILMEELDAAYDEALTMPVPENTTETFLDLLAALQREGIQVSDRRKNDGIAAVIANAWLSGHTEVQVGDLDIVQHMFWTMGEDAPKVRSIVLDFCNPGEKAALLLLDDLAELTKKYEGTLTLDATKRHGAALDLIKKSSKIRTEGENLRAKAMEGGASTIRIDKVIAQCTKLTIRIGVGLGLTPEQVETINTGR